MAAKIDRMWVDKELRDFNRGVPPYDFASAERLAALADAISRHLRLDQRLRDNLETHLEISLSAGDGMQIETDAADIAHAIGLTESVPDNPKPDDAATKKRRQSFWNSRRSMGTHRPWSPEGERTDDDDEDKDDKPAKKVVDSLLSEEEDEHDRLWTQLIALPCADDDDDPVHDLIDFVSQVYNGGVTQYVDNDYDREGEVAMYLRAGLSGCPQAKSLGVMLKGILPAIRTYREESQEAFRASREGEGGREGDEDDSSFADRAEEAFDAFEDWVYDRANMDPIYACIVAQEAPSSPPAGHQPEDFARGT
jgi:hypothetical protein